MINIYKSHSKKTFANIFTKNVILKTLLFVGILFGNQTLSFAKTSNLKKADAASLIVSLSKTDPICEGFSNGSITTTVSNGVAPYAFLWNDGNINQNRINVPRGTYTVDVIDALGDTGTATITLVDPNPINVTGAGGNDVVCNTQNNGNRFINVSGGTSPYAFSWTLNGTEVATTQDLTNKPAGTYQLSILDANNCSGFATFTILEPNAIGITETLHTNNAEFGESNGVINLDVTGGKQGVAPASLYTYLWNDGATTEDRTGLSSGTYTITVTDANNCTRQFTTDILPLSKFEVSGTFQNNKCSGAPNGSIDITAIGGIAPYTFKWSDQASVVADPDRTGLSAGTYTLIAKDNNGAGVTKTLSFTITDPTLLNFTATPTNNVCFADNLGKIDLVASGGLAPYSYILDGGSPVSFAGTTFTISNLSSGPHTVTITDANNCIVTPAKSLDILPLKALGNEKVPLITEVTCLDDKSGAIQVFIEGGQPPYLYKWSNDPNLNSAINPNLSVGNYTLQVTDSYGCVLPPATIAVTVQSAAITLTKGPQTNNVCFNDKIGSATFTLSGGTPNYIPTWTYEGKPIPLADNDPSQNKITVNNLPSGKYTLVVSDQKGCTSTTLTIDITPFIIFTNPTITSITCGGKDDATIEVNPSGGTSGYNYTWTSTQFTAPQTTPKIGPLAPGRYDLKITDGSSGSVCALDTTFIISNPTPITALEKIFEKANVCIPDSANGSVKIKITGGSPPYTSFQFSVIDPSTGLPVALAPTTINPNFPDVAINNTLLPGNYILTVTDQKSCPSAPIEFSILRNNCDPANDKIQGDPSMSPNDDGQGNNFFYINKIEDYPENEVIIYNRWGMEVFTMLGYDNKDRVFTGYANSKLTNRNIALVDGVYYFTIRTVMDKKQKVNKGYIIMKR